MSAIICFFSMLLSLAFLVYNDFISSFWGIVIWKTISSTFFVLTGYFAYKKLNFKKWPLYHKCIFIGLIFSLGGDFFLAFDYSRGIFFVMGLISFSFAHISYITGFFQIHKLEKLNVIWTCIFLLLLIFILTLLDGFNFQGLFPIILLYAFIISLMVSKSFSLKKYFHSHKKNVIMTITGTVLFLVSDVILLFSLFMPDVPLITLRILNHIIYYTGQGILALSLSVFISNGNVEN